MYCLLFSSLFYLGVKTKKSHSLKMSKDDELEPEWETYESCCWKVFAINCFVLPTFSSSQINTDKATILKKFSIACGKHVFSKLNGCFMKPNTHLPILLLSNMFFFAQDFVCCFWEELIPRFRQASIFRIREKYCGR